MPINEKIKKLRKEKGWSQDVLGEKINVHGRHISRYENRKYLPSVEAVIKLAKAFNVSLDYLLLDDAPRQPLAKQHDDIVSEIQNLGDISEADRSALMQIIEAIAAKYKLKSMVTELR